MIVYFGVLAILLLVVCVRGDRTKARGQVYYIVLLLLFAFCAFRFEVGCDWSGYLNQWQAAGLLSSQGSQLQAEPAWWAMMRGIQNLGLSYPWLNVASAAIFFAGLHVLARRQPDPLGFLILLFPILIINIPMSGIRQGAAIGLMCVAFAAFVDKKLISFIIWTLVATAFHSSAIVFILMTPLVHGGFSKKSLFLAGLCAVPGLLVLLSGGVAEQAATRYIGTDVDAAGSVFRLGLLLATALAYFWVLRRPWKPSFPKDYKLASVGALIMGAMIILVPISSVIGDRLGYYLVPVQAMILARIPYLPFRQPRALYSAIPYGVLGLVFVVWASLSLHFAQCYIPYNSWIFGMPRGSGYVF